MSVADDPDALHLLRPVKKLVDHIDQGGWAGDPGVTGGEMDGMSVKSERLTVAVVVGQEG